MIHCTSELIRNGDGIPVCKKTRMGHKLHRRPRRLPSPPQSISERTGCARGGRGTVQPNARHGTPASLEPCTKPCDRSEGHRQYNISSTIAPFKKLPRTHVEVDLGGAKRPSSLNPRSDSPHGEQDWQREPDLEKVFGSTAGAGVDATNGPDGLYARIESIKRYILTSVLVLTT